MVKDFIVLMCRLVVVVGEVWFRVRFSILKILFSEVVRVVFLLVSVMV